MHDLLQTGSRAGAPAYSIDKILTVWKDKQVIISFTENTAATMNQVKVSIAKLEQTISLNDHMNCFSHCYNTYR